MTKALLLVAILCGPALADSKTTSLGFALTNGQDARHYAMKLAADACGSVQAKAPQQEDEIKVCLKHEGSVDVRLEIDWMTRRGDQEFRNRSTVVAAAGQSFDLDSGVAKLTVTLK